MMMDTLRKKKAYKEAQEARATLTDRVKVVVGGVGIVVGIVVVGAFFYGLMWFGCAMDAVTKLN